MVKILTNILKRWKVLIEIAKGGYKSTTKKLDINEVDKLQFSQIVKKENIS